MPLYEYECDQNGHRFEIIRKFSDPPVDSCPTCGSPVHKLMSSPAIQFKGSGWYVTDYARKSADGKDAKTAKEGGEAKDSKDTKDTKDSKDTKSGSSTKSETPAAASPASSSTGKE